MKRKVIISTLLLLAVFVSYGQGPINLEYNFSTGLMKINTVVPYKGFARFRIKNINTFLYDIKVDGRNIDYPTPIPDELKAIFGIKQENSQEEEGMAEEALQMAAVANDNMVKEAKEVAETLSTTKESFLRGEKDIDEIAIKALEEFNEIMKELEKSCANYVVLSRDIKNLTHRKNIMLDYTQSPLLFNEIDTTGFSTQAENLAVYFAYEELYEKLETLYETAIDMAKKNGFNEEVIKKAYDRIEEGYEEVEKIDMRAVISDIYKLESALANKKSFEFISLPVQAKGDFVEFEFTAKPRSKGSTIPAKTYTSTKYEVPVKGGWKADFSTGPTLSFGRGAKDDALILERSLANDGSGNLTETGILKREASSDQARPGIAAMIHAHRRTDKDAVLGGMLGVGVGFTSIDDTDFSFYTGLSLIIGKRQKFMISGGVSFHHVDRLKGDFQIGETYNISDIELGSLTNKAFRKSGFIGLSYAIGNRVVVK